MRTREDIIRYARELRREYHTQNPYKLAEHFGIRVVDGFHTDVSRKAFTVKMEAYPTMIMLNAAYDKKSRMVLCAHELGHALLHEEGMNHFSVNEKNVFTNTEYEANLLRAYRHLDACRFKNKGWPCPTCPSCCFCGKDYETMTEVMDFAREWMKENPDKARFMKPPKFLHKH